VRDDDDRARPRAQQPREVVDARGVQVVGGLVEEQHVRALPHAAREPHAVPLADAQLGQAPVRLPRRAEPRERLVDAPVDVPRGELLVARHRRGQRGQVAVLVVERRDDLLELRGHGPHARARRVHQRPDRVVGTDDELLLDDRERPRAPHGARDRLQVAREQAQQGRLPGAVLADETDALPRRDRQVEPVDHGPPRVAEGHRVGDELHRPGPDVVVGHQPPAPSSGPARTRATTGASARNACPRWLMAFFSAGLSSAHVRVSPSGTSAGS